MTIHRNKRFCGGRKVGPAPQGAFRGRARQITACAPEALPPQARNMFPQARVVPQKKVTGQCHWSAFRSLYPPKYCLCFPKGE